MMSLHGDAREQFEREGDAIAVLEIPKQR